MLHLTEEGEHLVYKGEEQVLGKNGKARWMIYV